MYVICDALTYIILFNIKRRTNKKRTSGPTWCLKIYGRPTEDQQDVILDDDGEPIGPNDKTVFDF